eukprot:gnl/TRDRNA2_/TRDRNA2_99211_c2_seq1.p1 gnl/TRDRNA2_/TRDRNA2_99211_c2~~gnl/TRDRNA2_/TRDRNA2_99211_c2_seq1.p1  ORF type:complete len:349 (+),score=29.15 gnl/TRDRNA2_/TRDRNA2_99211_c2_seq1:84-1130(+)
MGVLRALSFRQLLGGSVYSQAWNITFSSTRPDISSAGRTCDKRSAGRVWQSMKKFYGTASLDRECATVLVVDAESFPFRRDNFTDRMLFYARRQAFHVSMWYPNANGCNWKHTALGSGEDDCEWQVAKAVNTKSFFRYEPSNNWEDLKTYFQQVLPLEQFWPYYPAVAKRMLDFGNRTLGGHFALEFPRHRVADVSWYVTHMLHFAAEPDTNLTIINIVDEIKANFPDAWTSCCKCQKHYDKEDNAYVYYNRAVHRRPFEPCRSISQMGSKCFQRSANMSKLGRWFVEHLGIFGAQHYVMKSMPESFLAGNGRFYWSWCINNCQSRDVVESLFRIPEVNETLLRHVLL